MVNVMVDDGAIRKFYKVNQTEFDELCEKAEGHGLEIDIVEFEYENISATEILNQFGSLGL